MKPKFTFSTDCSKKHTMHTKSDNIEIMIVSDTDEIIEEHFGTLLEKYQEGLNKSMKSSNFVFDKVNGLHSKCHKISLNVVGHT